MLEEINSHNLKLVQLKTDEIRTQSILKVIAIEGLKIQLEAKKEDLESAMESARRSEEKYQSLEAKKSQCAADKLEVESQLLASDYGQKEKRLKEIRNTIRILAEYSKQWRNVLHGLEKWKENEEINNYLSNPALQTMEEIENGDLTDDLLERLKKYLKDTLENVEEEISDLEENIRKTRKELKEKKEIVDDLKNDRKPYSKESVSYTHLTLPTT